MRHGLPLLAVAAIAGAACSGTPTPPRPPLAAVAAAPLPSTPVVTLDGTSTDLRQVLRGRVGVVSLWATWCEACLGEIEALERLQTQALTREDAMVVGVAVGETRETVAAFARQRRLPYAQLVDETFRLADALGEQRVPATLVVDRDGRIVYRGGALDHAGLAAFRSALGAGP
jgi:peroxiredoxin